MISTSNAWTANAIPLRSEGRRPGIGRTPLAVVLCLAILVPMEAAAQTALIRVGNASGNAGTSVDLTVAFTPGATGISTLQFDLTYPSALAFVSTTTDSAADAAGKSASSSTITGGIRVLIFGLNQNVIGAGPIAIVRLAIAPGTAPQVLPESISGITASDPDANPVPATGSNGSVTVTQSGDVTPPVISGVSASNITSGGATISWTTNEPSDSQVEYGTTTAYGNSTALNPSMVTSHSQNLTGLTPGTLYHYRVKSRDAAGNLATSGDYTFTTSSTPDTTPPVISGITVSNITATSATVFWTTSEPAVSQVDYGLTASYGSSTSSSAMVLSHALDLNGLAPQTLYHYRVRSADPSGNFSVGPDLTFITSAAGSTLTRLTLRCPRVSARPAGGMSMQGAEYTGLALANFDNIPALLTFTAFDSSGNRVEAPGLSNPSYWTLTPREQLAKLDYQLFSCPSCDLGPIAYFMVESTTEKLTGFYMLFDGDLRILDGASMSPTPSGEFVLPEIAKTGFTKIDIVNPSAEQAQLRIELRKAAGGSRAVMRFIGPGSALSLDVIGDLFPDATLGDHIYVEAGRGLLASETFGVPGVYANVLNAQPAAAAATTLYSPQYVDDAEYRSGLTVVNLDNVSDTVSFRLFSASGGQLGVTRELEIAPLGKLLIAEQDFFGSFPDGVEGYVEITSRRARLAGSVVFGDPGRARFSTALPLVGELRTSQLFSHVASSPLWFMGIAMVNPGDAAATVTIDLYKKDGTRAGTKNIELPPRGRQSKLLTDYFPELNESGQEGGYVRLFSNQGVAAFALFGTRDLNVLSAIPAQPVP